MIFLYQIEFNLQNKKLELNLSMTENTNSKFPSEADVVIVGVGGIVGSMIAYWLSELVKQI